MRILTLTLIACLALAGPARADDPDPIARIEAALKTAGKIRLEGKEYVIQDGDVVNFRFNV